MAEKNLLKAFFCRFAFVYIRKKKGRQKISMPDLL